MARLSVFEIAMIWILVLVIASAVWFFGFHQPMEAEMAALAEKTAQAEEEIWAALDKIQEMEQLQAYLKGLPSMPPIASHDNRQEIEGFLKTAFGEAAELEFADPKVGQEGNVRRDVTLRFTAESYAAAREALAGLENTPWRSVVTNVTVDGGETILSGEVRVMAVITFFETTQK